MTDQEHALNELCLAADALVAALHHLAQVANTIDASVNAHAQEAFSAAERAQRKVTAAISSARWWEA